MVGSMFSLVYSLLTAALGVASDAVRDQVMRHDPGTGVFNGAYINNAVRFNVQDAFLESDISDDGLTRAFTHMSIRCNPGAPREVPKEVMGQLLAADPEITGLRRRFKESRTELQWEYGLIKRAPKCKQKEHQGLGKQLKNAEKSLRTELEAAHRKDYFYRIHNEMMKRQLQRHLDKTMAEQDTEELEPVVQHQLEERMRVQQVLCDLSKDLSPQDIVTRKILAINLMTALASRQELQTRKPRSTSPDKDMVKTSPPSDPFSQLDKIPLILGKTQCIICIGNERLQYKDQTRAFKRVSHMWDHVEDVHLRRAHEVPTCGHPVCKAKGLVLKNVMHFKNHVATVHGINLRP